MQNKTGQSSPIVDTIIKCLDCGTGFTITPQEREWYYRHNYNLPKRCRECRQRRREGGQRG